MSEVMALGVSHKTAPLDLRERLALTEGRAVAVLGDLIEAPEVHEAAAISTCNRTELYLFSPEPVGAESRALGVLARNAGIRPTELVPHLYSLRGAEAAMHLFRVTAGLDSMIIGEAEVHGQVKRAYELALVEGASGPVLNRLFQGGLAAAGRARSETGISEGTLSVPQVAVEMAQRALGDLDSRRVVLVGAGETAELTARALATRGVKAEFIANRHHDRAIGLAQRFGGRAVRFEEMPALLAAADIVVSSTSSPHHVIERDALAEVLAQREGRPLLMMDLAVPRDVHPGCRELTGVTVHDMDDLQAAIGRNAQGREAEARRAEVILSGEVERFESWLGAQQATPTIAALRKHADGIVQRALEENEGRWERMSAADRERLGAMARAIASRLLHEPTLRLKGSSTDDDSYRQVHALRALFGLDTGTEPLSGEGAPVSELDERRRARDER